MILKRSSIAIRSSEASLPSKFIFLCLRWILYWQLCICLSKSCFNTNVSWLFSCNQLFYIILYIYSFVSLKHIHWLLINQAHITASKRGAKVYYGASFLMWYKQTTNGYRIWLAYLGRLVKTKTEAST